MSIKSYAVCDKCSVVRGAVWNGEHWIAPREWAEVCTPEYGAGLDLHLCPFCIEIMQKNRDESSVGFSHFEIGAQVPAENTDKYVVNNSTEET